MTGPITISEIRRGIELAAERPISGAIGAAPDEIDAYARLMGRPLPDRYVEFLQHFGRSCGELVLNGDHDFSLGALRSAFALGPTPRLLPIARSSGEDSPDYLCLGEGAVDPELYASSDYACKKDLDAIVARRFTRWFAVAAADSHVIGAAKYRYELRPELCDRYFDIARVFDIDAAVAEMLAADKFAALFPGMDIAVYVGPDGTFVTYYRGPTHPCFVVRVGAADRAPSEHLRAHLTALLKNPITAEPL